MVFGKRRRRLSLEKTKNTSLLLSSSPPHTDIHRHSISSRVCSNKKTLFFFITMCLNWSIRWRREALHRATRRSESNERNKCEIDDKPDRWTWSRTLRDNHRVLWPRHWSLIWPECDQEWSDGSLDGSCRSPERILSKKRRSLLSFDQWRSSLFTESETF